MKKGILLLLLAASLLTNGAAAGKDDNGSGKPKKIVIGYQAIPNGQIISKDFGWLEEATGIPVQWVQVNSGSELNTGLAAGSIDIGLSGSSGIAAGIANAVPFDVIWIHDIIGDNEALVVKNDSGITDVKSLAGKRIAVPFGATTHYHLLAALELEGIDPETVEIFDMQPPDALAAWHRGDIDGSFIWEPTLAKMLESDGKVVIYSRKLAAAGYLTGDITVARKGFAEKYPEIVTEYIKGEIRAVDYYNTDSAGAAEAVSRQFDIPAAEAARQMKSLVLLTGRDQLTDSYLGTPGNIGNLASVLKATADFLVTQQTILKSPDLEVFKAAIHPEYIEKALEQ
ncbi:glycine betaine ABC transporter substrate-binding protein [Spirochaeta isovalerica]|uniref:Taurine transport system substrate-binding protein n=1 Tax=Spirochaeta isovalerica TaxID=150 RepID=A0A841RAS0_9SPIO|nr:glycine betaine ABC transporter substrate-binding protein [Spirochaeta isovalerica]MBB6479778.1 taurine transport system substrate-binding protein [Spirochaeta isovalerica]